jgi:hypothetical protein
VTYKSSCKRATFSCMRRQDFKKSSLFHYHHSVCNCPNNDVAPAPCVCSHLARYLSPRYFPRCPLSISRSALDNALKPLYRLLTFPARSWPTPSRRRLHHSFNARPKSAMPYTRSCSCTKIRYNSRDQLISLTIHVIHINSAARSQASTSWRHGGISS